MRQAEADAVEVKLAFSLDRDNDMKAEMLRYDQVTIRTRVLGP